MMRYACLRAALSRRCLMLMMPRAIVILPLVTRHTSAIVAPRYYYATCYARCADTAGCCDELLLRYAARHTPLLLIRHYVFAFC